MRFFTLLLLTVSFFFFPSCESFEKVDKFEPLASKYTTQYYEYLKNEHADSTMTLFSDSFFEDVTIEKYKKHIAKLMKVKGGVSSYELERNEISRKTRNGVTTNEFSQIYKVVYLDGFMGKERFTFLVINDSVGKIESIEMEEYK